ARAVACRRQCDPRRRRVERSRHAAVGRVGRDGRSRRRARPRPVRPSGDAGGRARPPLRRAARRLPGRARKSARDRVQRRSKSSRNPVKETVMQVHKTVSRAEWLEARRALLAKEKELLHAKEQLRRETRDLPWVKVDKAYLFEGPDGKETLSELFAGRSQLIVKHFMLGPGWQQG